MRNILSIDQGTTSSRAILFTPEGRLLAEHQLPFKQYFPKDGWVEHDPNAIWQTTKACCEAVLRALNLSAKDITGIAISNQRETTILWDKQTGQPVYPAIVWQDRRTAAYCNAMASQKTKALITDKTGLLLDAYFSASKIAWILEHVEGARHKAEQGQLLFGTVDSYLIWQLTAGKSHVTDASNAARTLLFNIHTQQWDDALLELFNIPKMLLPRVLDNIDDFGKTHKALFGAEIPILCVAGDQQAASIGQACFEAGMAKSTYGTGCFIMMNTGSKVIRSKVSLLSTVLYRLEGKVTYALEGSIFNAGTVIQWFRDKLHLIKDASETEAIAASVSTSNNLYVVPAFTGLGAPYWDPNARGAILGLTRDTTDKEIVRAGLEAVCYQTRDLVEAMRADGAIFSKALRVDGGMVANNWFLQFLADTLQLEIERPICIETTALGVAYLAAIGAGYYSNLDEVSQHWQKEQSFLAKQVKGAADQSYEGWKSAVKRILS